MIQEAEYDTTTSAFEPNDPAKGLTIEFYTLACEVKPESVKQGRPIFRDVEYIRVHPVGDRSSIIERPVIESDKRRFYRHYERFSRQHVQTQEGTPLSQWPIVTRAQVEEFKFFGIHTVEQLAEIADVNSQNFMGMTSLKQKAIAYLEAAKGNAPLEKMQAELVSRDNTIATLQQQVNDLVADMKKLRKEKD